MAEPSVARFVEPSEEEVKEMLVSAVPRNTRKATDRWKATFESFYHEQNIEIDLATCSGEHLNEVLCKCYPAIRTKKGYLYKKASYFAARSAVHRKVRELNRPFNLFKSACFSQSDRVLDATLKARKAAGLEPAVNHKEALSNSDREKLKDYYSNVLEANDPIKLSMYLIRCM